MRGGPARIASFDAEMTGGDFLRPVSTVVPNDASEKRGCGPRSIGRIVIGRGEEQPERVLKGGVDLALGQRGFHPVGESFKFDLVHGGVVSEPPCEARLSIRACFAAIPGAPG